MESLLALDQGRWTGWAHCVPGCEPVWGEQEIWPEKRVRELDLGEMVENFHFFLTNKINVYRPTQMIRETVYVGGGRVRLNPRTILQMAAIAGHVDFVARRKGVSCWEQSTRAAVKELTGRADYDTPEEKKEATVEACRARGWIAGQHAADALALLMFMESKLYPETALKRRMVLKVPRGPLFREMRMA